MSTELKPKKIKVKLSECSYDIFIGKDISLKLPEVIKNLKVGNFCIIVTNSKLMSFYRKRIDKMFKGMRKKIVLVPDSETAKSKKYLFEIIDVLINTHKFKQKPFVVCFGGGVVGDLGGFAASIYRRGVPVIQIPTTFLAQIDASIGGKTAIDYRGIKNIVGAFYQPKAVIIDPVFLKTLEYQHFSQGISEAIKYGAIMNKPLFNFMEKNSQLIKKKNMAALEKIIYQCAKNKAYVVSNDERETKGLRTILNFGHTVAHAIEGCVKFKNISHGKAVALGMIVAGHISYAKKYCKKDDLTRLNSLIEFFDLSKGLKLNKKALLKVLMHDKKFINGTIRMVLLQEIGKVKVVDNISLSLVGKNLQHIDVE